MGATRLSAVASVVTIKILRRRNISSFILAHERLTVTTRLTIVNYVIKTVTVPVESFIRPERYI